MRNTYRKAAPKRSKRTEHNGVPQLAAQLCGCSLTMAYKVIYGNATSAKVQRAVDEARVLLAPQQPRATKGRAA
jgi:hypothetical protein